MKDEENVVQNIVEEIYVCEFRVRVMLFGDVQKSWGWVNYG